ncbi:MAG TPA: hypothetical protein VK573_03115 [Gemmatimonadales bacterium]|nr:hypothetical protein [Gemmatimonadales bacterium]
MTQTIQTSSAARGAQIIHAALVIGLLLAGATFFLVMQVQRPDHMPSIGLALGGIALAILAGSFAFLRGRVPERRSDQSSNDYWQANENRGPAIVLWVGVESAGILSLMGYIIGGQITPAAVAVLAIIALILVRPARLEG